MRKMIGFKMRDMWYNLGEAIMMPCVLLFVLCLSVM